MEYGPALQTSIGSIILSDLQHTCKNGESVQLFSITSDCLVQESINLLYRKVKIIFYKHIMIINKFKFLLKLFLGKS